MSQTVFGAPAVVTMLNRAFNNASPANAVFNNQVAEAGTTDASQIAFANAFGASFAGLSDAALSAQVLGNLGVLPNAELEAAVTQYFADNGLANRGLVVLQLGQILSTLETAPAPQDIFNAAAAKWNTEVEKSFVYSSNVANTTAFNGDFPVDPVNPGQTLVLTTGQDNITGTGGNDTIIGVFDGGATSNQNTLTAADVVGGGAGKDALNVTLDVGSAGVLPGAQYSSIENFFIRNVSGVNPANTFNFATVTGEEQVWNDRSSNDVVVTGLAAGTTVGVKGNGSAVTGATNATFAATATAANIALDGGIATGSGSVTVAGSAALTAATLTSTNGANTIGGLNLSGAVTGLTVDAQSNVATGAITGAGLTTITVKGAGSANLSTTGGALLPATVTTVNAADNAGGVTAALNGQTNFKFTGGSGNDVVTTGAILVATAAVDAGAGTADRLVVSNTNHIRVDGTSKALGDLYKGFEQVQAQNGVNLNLANLSTNNTIDTVRINDTSGTTSVTGISAAGAQNVSILNAQGAITIGLAGATTTGQIDTVKAAVTTTTALGAAQFVSLSGVQLAGVENLELTGSNGPIAANVGSINVETSNAIDLASIKLNNANAVDTNGGNDNLVTISGTHRAINLNVDATGSGDTRIDASAYNTITGATLTTGAGNDIITGSARSDIISGGAGDDNINGGDTVTAGAVTPASADQVSYNFTGATVVAGDTVAVTIGGQLYNATATAATPLNLANALANAIATGPANANIDLTSVTVVGNTVVVNGTATGLAANLVADANAVITNITDPAVAALATVVTPTTVSANATAASATLTFGTAAGTFVAGDVVAYDFTDADGTTNAITYTVLAGDVVAGDGAATAANVAAGFNAAILADGGVGTQVAPSRAINVVTIASNTAGQSVVNSSVTLTVAPANTSTGAALAQVSEGTDATTDTDTIDFTGLTFATGDVVAAAFNDGGAVAASYTVLAGDNLAAVLTGLEAAIELASGASASAVAGNTIVLTHGTAGAANTITGISTTVDRAPITTNANVGVARVEGADATMGAPVVTAAADRLSGGEGNDVFVVNYSNVLAVDLVNMVTFSAMDSITDLNLGGSAAGTNVDTIDLPFAVGTLVNAGTPVAMAATAADLYDAVQALFNTGGVMDTAAAGTAGLFTFNGGTYLIAEQAGNSVFDANDIIINVTGVTGTLSLTDLV